MASTFGQIVSITHPKNPTRPIPRGWQLGDALSESFRASNPAGFEPGSDVGDPGPGDAMTEFERYDHFKDGGLPLYDGNSWDNLIFYTSSYIDPRNPVLTDTFLGSNPLLETSVEWRPGAPHLAAWPIRVYSYYYGKLWEIYLHTAGSKFMHSLDMRQYPGRDGTWTLDNITGVDFNDNEASPTVRDYSYDYLHIIGNNSRVVGTRVSWWWSNNLIEDPNATWYETEQLSGTQNYHFTTMIRKSLTTVSRSSDISIFGEVVVPGLPPGSGRQQELVSRRDVGPELTEHPVSASGYRLLDMVRARLAKEGDLIRLLITYAIDYSSDINNITKVRYQSLTEGGFEQGLRITNVTDSSLTWTWETIIN